MLLCDCLWNTLSLAHSIQWSMTAGNDLSVQYGTSSSTGSLFSNTSNMLCSVHILLIYTSPLNKCKLEVA